MKLHLIASTFKTGWAELTVDNLRKVGDKERFFMTFSNEIKIDYLDGKLKIKKKNLRNRFLTDIINAFIAFLVIRWLKEKKNLKIVYLHMGRGSLFGFILLFLFLIHRTHLKIIIWKHTSHFWKDGYKDKRVKLKPFRFLFIYPFFRLVESVLYNKVVSGFITVSELDLKYIKLYFKNKKAVFSVPPLDIKKVILENHNSLTEKKIKDAMLKKKIEEIVNLRKKKELIILHYGSGVAKGTIDIIEQLTVFKEKVLFVICADNIIKKDLNDFVISLPRLPKPLLFELFKIADTVLYGNPKHIRGHFGLFNIEFILTQKRKVVTCLALENLEKYGRVSLVWRRYEEIPKIIESILKNKNILKVDDKDYEEFFNIVINDFDPNRVLLKLRTFEEEILNVKS